jgi:hypothetical protein
MGFIGYAVKLIHIPINNILVLNALFGGLGLIIRSLEIDFSRGRIRISNRWRVLCSV